MFLDKSHIDGEEESRPRRVLRALHSVLGAHARLMGRTLAQHGMHPGQAMCLGRLAEHDGITQRDLAEMLHIARPTVTIMLQKMEKAGVIERRPDESDQRYTRIYITELGRETQAKTRVLLGEIAEETVGKLAEEDQRELERLLASLNANILDALGHGAEERTCHSYSEEDGDS